MPQVVAHGQHSPFWYIIVIGEHLADFVKAVNVTVLYLALPDHMQDLEILQKIYTL
jgi:hypothetical protein